MKFLVDAQLPFRLAKYLISKGCDAIHTDNLPERERTGDSVIRAIARADGRIVISKDRDFFDSYQVKKDPAKLLLISTGNIVNRELIALFEANFDEILDKFNSFDLLELTNHELIAFG